MNIYALQKIHRVLDLVFWEANWCGILSRSWPTRRDTQRNHVIACGPWCPTMIWSMDLHIWRFPEIVVSPFINHFNRMFHCKPSILGYHHLWKPLFG